MGPVKALALAAAMLAPAPVSARSVADWRPYIAEASVRFGVPVAWIEQVMRAESGGRTRLGGRPITSHAGAMGLMQLMPGTWTEMRSAYRLGNDPHDPRDNIIAGTAYLRMMHDRFGYPGMFAAYNAGPGRYAEHLATSRALPGETRAYLAAVTGGHPADQNRPIVKSAPTIFVVLRARDRLALPGERGAPPTSRDAEPSRLFVALSQR